MAAGLVTLVLTNTDWVWVYFPFAYQCSHLSWALPPPSRVRTKQAFGKNSGPVGAEGARSCRADERETGLESEV